ncbi:MAG: methyltransferase domain-containing protein [Opitutales bacterium]|nr:methyltransferase domain-containing protein [Opitutales bacterium]
MEAGFIKNYFSQDGVVCDYARAALNVGLWASEKIVFEKCFKKSGRILELGCGAGRIAHGLCALGYSGIVATDFSENMISVAKAIAQDFNDNVEYQVMDAADIKFPDNSFDGAIFGFNGLMQIPKRGMRRRAMSEIFRVLKSGALFAFTTHDRDAPRNAKYWEDERRAWRLGSQGENLDEFGDICYQSEHGGLFIHSPTRAEVEEDMLSCGFEKISAQNRSDIAGENQAVKEFSDECIFWVFKKG